MRIWKHPPIALLAPLASLVTAPLASSCGLVNANIFDTPITLSRQDYRHDFGNATGTVPKVDCSAQADPCQLVSDQLKGSEAQALCDTTKRACYAEASMTLPFTINLSQEQAFQSGVGQKAVQVVQKIEFDLSTTNALTFQLPKLELFVGPQDAKNTTDPGVVRITELGPYKAGQSVSSMTISVARGTPAFTQLEKNVQNPRVPFVFLLSARPRFDSGDPVPAGKIELRLTPRITVGLPR